MRTLESACRKSAPSLSHAGFHLFQKITAMTLAPAMMAMMVKATPNHVRLRSACPQNDLDFAGLLTVAIRSTTPKVIAAALTNPPITVNGVTRSGLGSLVEIPAIVAPVATMIA